MVVHSALTDDEVDRVFRALADATRRDILRRTLAGQASVSQLATAYDGATPVRTVVITTGMAGWETPPGRYTILHRVANETMTSGAIGAENFYRLDDVLFTQYFTDLGHALHFAWWRTRETIGRPGSHGCVNLLLDDARYFWDWAALGTPVYVHR